MAKEQVLFMNEMQKEMLPLFFTKQAFEQEFVSCFPDHIDYELHIAKEMWDTFEATWREEDGKMIE